MKINKHFQQFVQDYSTYLWLLMGGSGSGKSVAITQKIVLQCLQTPRTVLVLRKTGVTLNDSVIALFKAVLEQDNIPYTYRASDRTLLFGGSKVMFKPLEDPERIKSIIVDLVWLEEASEFTGEDFTQLVLRLRDPDKNTQFILSYNPISKTNYVYRFFHNPEDPEYFLDGIDYKMDISTWKDNAFLTQDYIDRLLSLKKSNPMWYRIYTCAEFGTLGKLIFPPGTYTVKAIEVPLGCRQVWGADPGVSDKFAINGSYYIKSTNTLYTFKEFSYSEVLCKDVAKWIKDNVPSSCTIWTDNAGKAQIQELNALGCTNVVSNSKPPGSVQAGIDKLHSLNWVIHPSCENLIKDLSCYSYEKDKKTGLYLNEPARETDGWHQNNCDATRYSLEGLGNVIQTVKIKGNSLLGLF